MHGHLNANIYIYKYIFIYLFIMCIKFGGYVAHSCAQCVIMFATLPDHHTDEAARQLVPSTPLIETANCANSLIWSHR